MTGQKCPGINRGALYSPQQIQTKKNNTHWWRPVLRPVRRSESEVGSSSDEDRSSIQPGKTSSEGRNAGNGATAKDGNDKRKRD
jgi:hypothetical protein